MKTIAIKDTTIDSCVHEAQHERIVVTRNGKPVALVIGVAGLDAEQIELGTSDAFWNLIADRRKQKTLDRAELERAIQAKRKKGNR